MFCLALLRIIEDPFKIELDQAERIDVLFGRLPQLLHPLALCLCLVSCHTYVTVMLFQGLFKEDSEWIQ